jgi:type II secretory pathway component PulM
MSVQVHVDPATGAATLTLTGPVTAGQSLQVSIVDLATKRYLIATGWGGFTRKTTARTVASAGQAVVKLDAAMAGHIKPGAHLLLEEITVNLRTNFVWPKPVEKPKPAPLPPKVERDLDFELRRELADELAVASVATVKPPPGAAADVVAGPGPRATSAASPVRRRTTLPAIAAFTITLAIIATGYFWLFQGHQAALDGVTAQPTEEQTQRDAIIDLRAAKVKAELDAKTLRDKVTELSAEINMLTAKLKAGPKVVANLVSIEERKDLEAKVKALQTEIAILRKASPAALETTQADTELIEKIRLLERQVRDLSADRDRAEARYQQEKMARGDLERKLAVANPDQTRVLQGSLTPGGTPLMENQEERPLGWMSAATDASGSIYIEKDNSSSNSAKALALRSCRTISANGDTCKVVTTVHNQCLAVARVVKQQPSPTNFVVRTDPAWLNARNRAVADCVSKSGKHCFVETTYCSVALAEELPQ